MKKILKSAMLVALTAAGFTACSDEYDPGVLTKGDIAKIHFGENFENAFGAIDPNQDWNLATQTIANVQLPEPATVKIYSENPMVTGAKLMANYQLDGSGTFNFDAPETTKEVFVQAVSKRGAIINGYYAVEDGKVNIALPTKIATRATDPCSTTIKEEEGIKVCTTLHVYYSGEEWNSTVNTKEFKLYDLENVSTSASTPWKIGDFRKILDTYKNSENETKDGVFKEGQNNWKKWVKDGVGETKLTGDVMFTMNSEGPVSLTLNYRQTGTTTNQFAYFYWTGDVFPKASDIMLYNLIPNATANNDLVKFVDGSNISGSSSIFGNPDNTQVQGTTFDLVYFGTDGNETPTFNFPPDTHIGFAMIQNNSGTGVNSGTSDKCWFSISSMNPDSQNWSEGGAYNNGTFPAAATFKMGDVTFLGFEDWPDNTTGDGGGSDLNDVLFFAVGDFKEDIPDIDPDPEPVPTQDWVLIYEDLGNSLDWDYNDVVLKVAHASGETTADITALAAGGTLSSHVFYDTTDLGEIHTWFGQSAKTSGENTVTNADGKGTEGETKQISVPATFSMTTLGSVANMGGITLKVKKAGQSDFSDETTTIAYSLDNKGTAPEVICLPGSWKTTKTDGKTYNCEFRWPKENAHIDDAYSGFAAWVANKSSNTEWYKAEPASQYCATGTFETVVSDGGNTDPITPPTEPETPTFEPVDETFDSFTANGKLEIGEYFAAGASSAKLVVKTNINAGYIWISQPGVFVNNSFGFNITGISSEEGDEYEYSFTESQLKSAIQSKNVEIRFGDGVVGLESIQLIIE